MRLLLVHCFGIVIQSILKTIYSKDKKRMKKKKNYCIVLVEKSIDIAKKVCYFDDSQALFGNVVDIY